MLAYFGQVVSPMGLLLVDVANLQTTDGRTLSGGKRGVIQSSIDKAKELKKEKDNGKGKS